MHPVFVAVIFYGMLPGVIDLPEFAGPHLLFGAADIEIDIFVRDDGDMNTVNIKQ